METLDLTPRSHLEPAPDPTAFDHAMMAAKVGALAFTPALPFLGPGVAFIDLLTAPLRGKRMSDWCEGIRLRVNDLSQKVEGFTWEKLEKDEAFFSAFAQATQAAIKTHQKEKLEALRNAVLNVALGKEPDADRQQQLLGMLDRFSETHLTILRFFNDPASYFRAREKPVPMIHSPSREAVIKLLAYQLIVDAMPSLREQIKSPHADRTSASFQFIEATLSDLISAKLVWLDRHQETWAVPKFDNAPAPSPVKKLTTHLGDDFLSLISDADLGKENVHD
jgi:hypothetical protein